MSAFASDGEESKKKFQNFLDNVKEEFKKPQYSGHDVAQALKTLIESHYGSDFAEGYSETVKISEALKRELRYAIYVILNFHGLPQRKKNIYINDDAVQMASIINRTASVPNVKMFDAIIGLDGHPNVGTKESIDEIKQKIRQFESLTFLKLVRVLYLRLFEILKIIKENLLKDILNKIDNCQENSQEEIIELQTLFAPYENPPDINEIIRKICDDLSKKSKKTKTIWVKLSESELTNKQIEQIKQNLNTKFDEIEEIYIKYLLNEFIEINLRHGTYVEEILDFDFESKHHENSPDGMMGIFIGAYDGSELDICFQQTIASPEFLIFLRENNAAHFIDEKNIIHPAYLKQKEHCILREGTLIYYILFFLGNNYFKQSETGRKNRYFELFEELSRNYDTDLPEGERYQTNMSNIIDFIDFIKSFALKHPEYLETKQLKSHSKCVGEITGGRVPAYFYAFTCAVLHGEALDATNLLRTETLRTETLGGTKKKRRKKQKRKKSIKRNKSIKRK